VIALLMAAQAAAAAPMPSFLAGCWEQQGSDGKWAEECWTAPRGGLMIGSGRAGHGDKVSNWEWMRIERSADGTLTFFASPGGAPAVGFKATAVDAASVTFANPAHDYPQRIRYARTAEGLTAEVSAADGSRLSRWTYRRSGTAD